MDGYKHYIRTDANGIVILGFTSAFPEIATPQDGDMLLTGQEERQFQLPLTNERGQYKLKVVNGQLSERTQAELDTEWAARPAPPLSEVEVLRKENEQLNLSIIELWESIIPILP